MAGPLPPKKETTRERSARLFERQWERLEDEAKKGGHSVNELLQHFIDWCFSEVDRMRAGDLHQDALRLLELLKEAGHDRAAEAARAKLAAELKKRSAR